MTRFVRSLTFGLVLAGLPAFGATLLASHEAEASVSIAVQFDELVERSKAVAVLVPIEQRAAWEGRSIITYTRMHVEDGIAGVAETGKEIWVASRGGVIGDLAQQVDGEPIFRVGRPALAFLREDIVDSKPVPASGLFIVTARAQGMFPVVQDAVKEGAPDDVKLKKRRLVASTSVGMLLPPKAKVPVALKALARDVLDEKSFDDARVTITSAWRRIHEKKP